MSLATEFAGDRMTTVNFFGLVLCLIGISVHVVAKATRDTESLKLGKHKIEELKLNGDIELKGLLLTDQDKHGSDDDNEEYELNIHEQR